MKKNILSLALFVGSLCVLTALAGAALDETLFAGTAPATLANAVSTKASILQTAIVPYLIANDCADQNNSINDELAPLESQLDASNSIIESAQDLLFYQAIPDASAIDSQLAELFSFTPLDGQNPSEPLLTQINDGLIPYLQAALIKLGDANKIVKISAGTHHTLVLTSTGKVYATGSNSVGQLGIGTFGDTRTTLTAMLGEGSSGVIDIATGIDFSLILKNNGAVYGVGSNLNGQLGVGTPGGSSDFRTTFTAMLGEGSSGVVAISAGSSHTVVLKGGAVYATGDNSNGQLGIGVSGGFRTTLTAMVGEGTSNVTAISAGALHTMIIKNNSGVSAAYAVGRNSNGQLATGSISAPITTLTAMIGTGTFGVAAISAGLNFSIVLKDTGAAYGSGTNTKGQLGDGTSTQRTSLTAMNGEGTSGVTAISAGNLHTLVLKNNNGTYTAYGTGDNSVGQLGVNTAGGATDFRVTLTAMVGEGASGIASVDAGFFDSIVLKDNKAAYATGINTDGELGVGDMVNRNVLTQMIDTPYLPLRY